VSADPRPAFDLQSHSVHSDGQLPAAEVVRHAAQAGVELLALSDHDTIDGVAEAIETGVAEGVRLVPATEISAVYAGFEDLHVLGYGIDHGDAVLGGRLEDARADRVVRAERMGEELRSLGFEIDPAPLEARYAAGKPIGRPHLAAAVIGHPANAERLEREGRADVSPFIAHYLVPGGPAYMPRTRPTVPEAIGWIHDAGGLAVWAHPFWDVKDTGEVLTMIDGFRAEEVDGVEAFYPAHHAEQTRAVAERCAELDLLTTGSSDFHGPAHKLFSQFRAFELHGLEPRLGPIAEMAA
jgi:3',5'-nucleoside bisphosphate phosphatase